jgi:hypothetical protein
MPIAEIRDAISFELSRCATRVSDHAALVEGTGALVAQLTTEIFRDSAPVELAQRAQGLQCVALRGMAVLAELYREAGRVEALAARRRVADEQAER